MIFGNGGFHTGILSIRKSAWLSQSSEHNLVRKRRYSSRMLVFKHHTNSFHVITTNPIMTLKSVWIVDVLALMQCLMDLMSFLRFLSGNKAYFINFCQTRNFRIIFLLNLAFLEWKFYSMKLFYELLKYSIFHRNSNLIPIL